MEGQSSFSRASLLFALGIFWIQFAAAEVIFQDDFESGTLSPAWEIVTTLDGRARVLSDFGPAGGQFHLVLDDRVNDTVSSMAAAILHLDLSHRRNVILSFKVKSLGNEPDYLPYGMPQAENFDGVSYSTDGGNTWHIIEGLADIWPEWQTITIPIDQSFETPPRVGADFRIRFSEYDNASAPVDGLAFDDVRIAAELDLRTLVEVPPLVIEGSGPHVGFVMTPIPPTNDTTFTLVASPGGQLILPASVVIPAGQTAATFEFSVVQDDAVNLTRSIFLSAQSAGYQAMPSVVTVRDDETPVATLLLPTELTEGAPTVSGNARIFLDRAPAVPMSIQLTPSSWGYLDLPYWVTVPAGSTSAVFTVTAPNNFYIDGITLVTVTASTFGMASVTGQIQVIDTEARILTLELPETIGEGGTAVGVIQLSGTVTSNLVVQLTSGNPTLLSVPASVTIPSGYQQMEFSITAADNAETDGSRTVTLSASAETFVGTNDSIIIRDNEVVAYGFSGLTDIVDQDQPLQFRVSATDVEGNGIEGFGGSVQLSLLQGSAVQPLGSLLLSGTNGWIGSISLPPITELPLRLRVSDASGRAAVSNPFDVLRAPALTAADLIWDPTRARLYASLASTAVDPFSNQVVVLDPISGAVTGSVWVGQSPGRLAITSGGEFLYVALDANGSVARIDLATMTVAATFPVGVHPSAGTMAVDDVCTVAGQSNLLVVSQRSLNGYSSHLGVAVYSNGVARPTKTPEHYGRIGIEPSTSPTSFYSFNTDGSDNTFRRLQVNAAGVVETTTRSDVFNSFYGEFRSDGGWVFSPGGVVADGLQLRRLGTFPVHGPVCPDRAVNRAYFLQSKYPDYWYSQYDRIGVYSPATFAEIRTLTMPREFDQPRRFLRWGTNGLAFISDTNVILIRSSRVVPNEAPTDLSVSVEAEPMPATVGVPLTFTATVVNQGTNVATSAYLTFNLSELQVIRSAVASSGAPSLSSNAVTVEIGDLAPGAGATLVVSTVPDSAGYVTGTAGVSTAALDPSESNNTAGETVTVGFLPSVDAVQRVRVPANNLIYDPTRARLWASVPGTTAPPLARSVVSIDPVNGRLSTLIPIVGEPASQCMALSANGRYLYVGLSGTNQVLRLDLQSPGSILRITLESQPWYVNTPRDLEVLDGDGTSFLVVGSAEGQAMVYDGTVARGLRTAQYSVDRIERTGTPGQFIGYHPNSSLQFSTLTVTAAGVTNTRQAANVISSSAGEMRAAGPLALLSSGHLVNSTNLTLIADLGMVGRPCLDLPYQRAYFVRGSALGAFDTATFLQTGEFALPFYASDYWYESQLESCVRWGLDGFAFLSASSNIYIWRWSGAIPATADTDGDGIADAWEVNHFSNLKAELAGDADGDGVCNFLEYLFVTSPTHWSANPVEVYRAEQNGLPALRVVFPRRTGVTPPAYQFQFSPDLTQWSLATNVTESVLATQSIAGVSVDTVEALIPAVDPKAGFVRFRWSIR